MALNKIYNLLSKKLASGDIDWANDTIKIMLCTSSYTPNKNTHEFKSDVTNEVTGTGYTAGGKTLANASNSQSNLVTTLDADDVQWASSTITARYAVIYKDTGVAGTSPLIGYVDLESDQSSSNGNFNVNWNASGIYTLTVPA